VVLELDGHVLSSVLEFPNFEREADASIWPY